MGSGRRRARRRRRAGGEGLRPPSASGWTPASRAAAAVCALAAVPLSAVPLPAQDAASESRGGQGTAPDTVAARSAADTAPLGGPDLRLEPADAAATSLPELLDGRVPGLLVEPGSGMPGSGARLRLRGSSSLRLANTPLVYVDGVRATSRTDAGPFTELASEEGSPLGQTISRLEDLAPSEIASLRVLRGPAAAAAYGPGAASGVLLVETRRGQPGGPRVTVGTEQGTTRDVGEYPDNYLNVTAVSGISDPGDPRLDGWSPERNPVTGDLFVRDNPLEDPDRSPFAAGRTRAYHLSASGGTGTGRFAYFGSAAHREEDGVLPGPGLRRSNGRVNLSLRPATSLELGVRLGYVERETDLSHSGGFTLGILENGALGSPLHAYGEAEDGGRGACLGTELMGEPASVCEERRGYYRTRPDALARLETGEGLDRLTWGGTATWTATGWLTGRLRVGEDRVDTRLWELVPPGLADETGLPAPSLGFAALSDASEDRRTLEALVTISASLAERIETSTTVGFQRYDVHRDGETRACGDFPAGAFPAPGDDPATGCGSSVTVTGTSYRSASDQTGGFLQQRAHYRDFLSVHGSLRADEHSGVLDEDGTVWSPGAGASLLLHRMPWWGWEAADELRLRLAWGRSSRLATGPELLLPADPAPVPGFRPATAVSRVEETEEIEVGLDAAALDRRLALSASYYRQGTPEAFLGFTAPTVGALETEGLEASLRARPVEAHDITWDVALTLATADPVVTDLPTGPIHHDLGSGYVWEGYAPGAKMGPVVESAERDADGGIVPGSVTLLPGEGVSQLRFLGDVRPGDEESLSTTLGLFGGLRVHALFRRAGGHVSFDGTSEFGAFRPVSMTRRDAFRQVESSPEEQAALEAHGQPLRETLFVHDATFVRWRLLTVSWRLPDSWRERVLPFAESVTLSAGGRNLATWTDYPGLDPEGRATGGNEGFQQADQFTLPPVRSFYGRLSLTF